MEKFELKTFFYTKFSLFSQIEPVRFVVAMLPSIYPVALLRSVKQTGQNVDEHNFKGKTKQTNNRQKAE